MVDRSRLQAVLGSPELVRLLDALQKRIELGRPLNGALTLAGTTLAERAAVDTVLGRKSTQGASLRIDLDFLTDTLRDAGLCSDLREAVEALRGPLTDYRALEGERTAQWAEVWRSATADFAFRPELRPWLAKLASLGLLRRLSGDSPAAGAALLRDIATMAAQLPASAEPLAAFAARWFGDAHALDPGSPRANLAVHAAARIGGIPSRDDAEGRRAAWASVGIMSDELSLPVLVFNLRAKGETALARLLRNARAETEPLHVSLRLLLRSPLDSDSGLTGQEVFVCENPTIVALAANRLGPRCAALVCTNGQFATPSLVLLRQLRAAGARLRYHGDFDPPGVAIARRVFRESGAAAWRYSATDYVSAPKGVKFTGQVGETPWSPSLATEMARVGRAVHEEALFAELALDLALHGDLG
jgi:uncharacterized protein (TIGR02679 family)